jgi:hypothetical protein
MAKPIPNTLVPAREGDFLLISTSSGYWGKGKDIAAAKLALKEAGQYRAPKGWRVHSVDPRTYVDEDGRIVRPKEANAPLVVAEYDHA